MSGEMNAQNAEASANNIKTIVGPTILLGNGLYFDFLSCDCAGMTIDDYVWGLLRNNRFSGQTKYVVNGETAREFAYKRCLYNVLQHTVMLCQQMMRDGCSAEACYEGLMHESDEVVWGDFPGPAKSLMPPEFKALVKRAGDAIDAHFEVSDKFGQLVKTYDIRMLATEKRDLMPHARGDKWQWTVGYEPFDFRVHPWPNEFCISEFLAHYKFLREALS